MDGASGARVGWKKVILEGVGLSRFRVRVEGGDVTSIHQDRLSEKAWMIMVYVHPVEEEMSNKARNINNERGERMDVL